MGNTLLCFKPHKMCVICNKQFTEYYIACANCKKPMHDECEYRLNLHNPDDYCPGCGQISMYYKFYV